MNAKEKNQNWCMCETITGVCRDGQSTCTQCGGIDAYKKCKDRPKKGNSIIEPVHDFLWAVEQMKQGKKVRRAIQRLRETAYFEIFEMGGADRGFYNQNGRYMNINVNMVEATDWEILGEETLDEQSKRIITNQSSEEGTFMWAMEQVKQGKFVEYVDGPGVWDSKEGEPHESGLIRVNLEKTFRIKEEPKKTLWDKRQNMYQFNNMLDSKDVKEALKDYIKAMTDKLHLHKTFEDIAKEIFGSALLEDESTKEELL